MGIPKREKNKRLLAGYTSTPLPAVSALEKLKPQAKYSMVYSSDGKPELPRGGAGHLQGMSVYVGDSTRNRVVLSTSADKGKLIVGLAIPSNQHYKVKTKPVGYQTPKKVHPGGIQVIGKYVVVPIYYTGYKGIEIRDIINNLDVIKKFEINYRPYCVGITTIGKNSNEYYVLAIVTKPDGSRVDIYTSKPGYKLSDTQCNFSYFGTYRPNSNSTYWNYYSNNISLLSDTKDNIYFLGFYNTDKVFGYGVDKVDLHLMKLEDNRKVRFIRLSEFKTKRNHGSTRFGAGATVLNDNSIEIYTCERNGQKSFVSGMESIDCDLYNNS